VTDTDGSDHLKTAYDQLCNSYRAIDDFRAKLLGFLLLVTGGGLILLAGESTKVQNAFFPPAGLFGVAVTTGLLAYELFGIKKCHALLNAGDVLEQKMRLPAGQFHPPAQPPAPGCQRAIRRRGHLSGRDRRMDLRGTVLRSP
jgi:hypothetical protein